MPKANSWTEHKRKILAGLDIASVYREMKVEITGHEPNSDGWLTCRSYGRDDRNPSANINVGNGSARGRYHDFSIGGESLGLFDFHAKYFGDGSFKSSVRHFAQQLSYDLPKRIAEEKTVRAKFHWRKEWESSFAIPYCHSKPPITERGILMAGGCLGDFPAKSREFPVFIFPTYGELLCSAEPAGYVAVNRTGKNLMIYQGKNPDGSDRPKREAKNINFREEHAKPLWVGRWGCAHLRTAEIVWKVEGISDLLALQSIIPEHLQEKHVVVTNPNGCNETPLLAHAEHVSDRVVYVLHDADRPGQGLPSSTDKDANRRPQGAAKWCQVLATTAAQVRNVQLPYEISDKHGKDLRDFLSSGSSYDDLLRLAHQAPVESEPVGGTDAVAKVSEEDFAFEREVLAALEIDVLGITDSGAIQIYSMAQRESHEIRNIDTMHRASILKYCGLPARHRLNDSDSEDVEGLYSVAQVRDAIALIGGYSRVSDDNVVGPGVWQGRDKGGDPNTSIVLVGKKMGAKLNGSLAEIDSPRADGLVLEFGGADEWFDIQTLRSNLKLAENPQWRKAVLEEAEELFARWLWRHQDYDPYMLVGLILCTWVQTIFDWRPLVSVTGVSNSGKTSLLDCISKIFGPLAMKSSSSTEAGIRQAVKKSACVIMCDEFEDSKHRDKILELFRTSGRGDKILRGTAHQEGAGFGLRHIAWIAAIEVGLKKEPDKNRFISFEVLKPIDSEWGKLVVPSNADLAVLGQKLLAIAVHCAFDAKTFSHQLKSHNVVGIDRRVIESYSVPVGMLGAADGNFTIPELSEQLELVLEPVRGEIVQTNDAEDLLHGILDSPVDLGRGDRQTVGQILVDTDRLHLFADQLERHGVGVVIQDSEKFIFLHPSIISRTLLRDTDWQGQNLQTHLMRLPTATAAQHRMAGRRPRGIRISWNTMTEKYLAGPRPGSKSDGIFSFH